MQDAYLTLVERILVGPCGLRASEVDSLLGQENLRVTSISRRICPRRRLNGYVVVKFGL